MSTPHDRSQDDLEYALRPHTWDEYIGQHKVKEHVRLIIRAASERGEACDHLLFYGQAGLGKTTLAHLIGHEMKTALRVASGPHLERPGDVAAILSSLESHEILFVDEIHRMGRAAEEVLYPALETRRLHLVVGKGVSAKTVSLELPPFTLIAATTRANLLSSPLRSRFGASFRLDYYTVSDIKKILVRSAALLGVHVVPPAVALLAAASRFTPRVANRLLRRTRDYAQVHNHNVIDGAVVERTLQMLDIDHCGLESYDRELLRVIMQRFNGGPVGLGALAAALAEDPLTIQEIHEPYLMSIGFLDRTRVGRVVTDAAYEHLGVRRPGTL